MYIGNLCAQTNEGHNNIMFGYETIDNTAPSIITSTFSNTYAIYSTSTNNITTESDATHSILIGGDLTTGTVGIGTIRPDFYIGSNISATSTKLVVLGKVLANAYTLFTGAHKILLDNCVVESDLKEGMIMSAMNSTITDVNNTTITACISDKLNDKTVFGVYSGKEESISIEYDPPAPFSANSNVTITETKTVSTILYVNSLGEGGVLVSNYSGNVQNGDYITSSPIPGYGALQSDDIMHSYTVAKCTEVIDWATVPENIEYNSVKYKSVMVACTYHCG
jgi:hypothetical protein